MSRETKNTNLSFWESVEATDPSKTKPAKVGGQHRTAVDAQYKKMMITKAFGMYGLSWGVAANSEDFLRIHYDDSTCILQYKATAFYVVSGERGEFPIAAAIKEAYITSGGKGYLKIDDEAVKKVRTDALTKGFTDLGFCADIHMGKFDDQDYVHAAAVKANMDKMDEQEAASKAAYDEVGAWCKEQAESAKKLSNIESFNKAIDRIKEKAAIRCSVAGFTSKGFETRLDEIKMERNNEK